MGILYCSGYQIKPHRALNRTRLYAVRLYAVCMRPFRHSQQQRSVCTAAVQPAPDGLYQVECAVRAYCLSLLLCNQPWAKSGNFEASTVHFEVILKRLSNSYGNVILTKNTQKGLEIAREYSNFQNNLFNSVITASVWPYRNIILTLY